MSKLILGQMYQVSTKVIRAIYGGLLNFAGCEVSFLLKMYHSFSYLHNTLNPRLVLSAYCPANTYHSFTI